MVKVAEKITHNIGVLARIIREEPMLKISRSTFARLITDEELADVEYRRLAEHPAIKQNEYAHSALLGIASDERKHAEKLREIKAILEREGEIE